MKFRLLFFLMVAIITMSVNNLSAQTVVSGKVVDADTNEPLIGASVTVKNSSVGTVTDLNGAYSIEVPAGGTALVFSYIGYRSEEIAINGRTKIDAILTEGLDIDMVTVIGSRNATRTKLETAVPVDVIPIASIVNEIGQVDLNQILTYVAPSFQSARQTISDGTDHVDPGQLRGLGPDQVLILVNGKRRHQSALVNVNGTVNRGTVGTDLSAIPASSIERIEILRDGAAAQYGSDAIAGVINIVLKQRTGVIDGSVSYGFNRTSFDKNFAIFKAQNRTDDPSVQVTDGQTVQAGVNYGFNLGSKGFVNLTGEYITREPTFRSGTYAGQVYPSVNGQIRDDSFLLARGLNRDFFDMRIGQSKISGGGLFLNSELSLGGGWEAYVFSGYNRKNGEAAGFFRYPSSIQSGAAIYRNSVFGLYPNGFLPLIQTDITDFSLAAGLRGKLGDWAVDFSNTYGRNDFGFNVDNSVNYSQAAVRGSNLQTTFDAGSLSFVQNTVNADLSRMYDVMAGLNVAFGAEFRSEQFGIVPGEESSWRNYDQASGAAGGAQVFPGFLPANEGDNNRTSFAGYIDLEQDFSDKFMIAGALRFENYSDFGSTLNYKLASRYKVSNAFSIRGSMSTGFRAPSMQQRFYAKTNTLFVTINGVLTPVESGTFTNDSQPAKLLGIPQLKQETSQSYTLGITTRPADGLELTIDAYQIDIDDRVILTNNFSGGNDANLLAQLRAAGAQTANFFSNAVDTRARGIEAVLSYDFRVASKHEFKATLAGSFIKNEVKKDESGKVIIKASDVLVRTGQIANYFNREDQSRMEVAVPREKVNFTLNYKVGKFSAMARGVHFGKVIYLDPTMNPANPGAFPVNAFTGNRQTLDQTFNSKVIFDASVSYNLVKGITATIGGNNIFDTYQDRHTHSGNMSLGRFVYSRRVQQFGFNGAFWFARLKFDIK
jgi:iron complex outermembrane receptor protein